MRAAVEAAPDSGGGGQLVDVLAGVRRAEAEDRLHRLGPLQQLRGPFGEGRVDEQEPELGLVAGVQVVVERAQRVKGGVMAAGQGRGSLGEPSLRPVEREQAHALVGLEAALEQHGDPALEGVLGLAVADVASVHPEGDPVREAAQGGDDDVTGRGGVMKAGHGVSNPRTRCGVERQKSRPESRPPRPTGTVLPFVTFWKN